jgi:hypothetical protein
MSDDDLSRLFRQGTSPERDTAFDRQVEAKIGRLRRRARLLGALGAALRGAAAVAAAGALFLAVRAIEPWATRLLEGVPELLGVPAPLAIAALVLAAVLLARGRARLRG